MILISIKSILCLTLVSSCVAGASQPGGQPGGDPERTETAGAAAAAERGRAGRERAHSAPAGAPRHDGAATTQPGHTHSEEEERKIQKENVAQKRIF